MFEQDKEKVTSRGKLSAKALEGGAILGRSFYSAQKEIEEKLRQIEARFREIERREERKVQNLTVPVDLWLDNSIEEGGILIIQRNPNIRRILANILRRQGYKIRTAESGHQALSAFRKASYSLMIIHWGIFQRSSDLVGLLHKAFPQTRIIITSPNFAWPNENAAGAWRGMKAIEAGAYSYVPERHMRTSILKCIEMALASKERACPVLRSGGTCNLRCVL